MKRVIMKSKVNTTVLPTIKSHKAWVQIQAEHLIAIPDIAKLLFLSFSVF